MLIFAYRAEESCPGSRVTVAVNRRGQLCAVHHGRGLLHASSYAETLGTAERLGKDLFAEYDRLLSKFHGLPKKTQRTHGF